MSKASEIYKELQKSAGLGSAIKNMPLVQVLKDTDRIAAKNGMQGLKHLAKYKDPFFALEKGFKSNGVAAKDLGPKAGGIQKFLIHELGNTAHALTKLTENVSEQKGIIGKVTQSAKNAGNLAKDQMRGAMYKSVEHTDAKIIKREGKEYLQGKGLFKGKFFDRQVLGKTETGDYVVKKRAGAIPLALSATGPGLGATTLAMGTGNPKKDKPKDRVRAAGIETASWSVVPIFAQAKLVSDIVSKKEEE